MPKPRERFTADVVRAIHHEAGYLCANPRCRYILVLDVHHIIHVAKGGGNDLSNLLALCRNCHGLHHQGVITEESVRTWKMVLMTLNNTFDRRCVDVLLMLDKLEHQQIQVSPDAALHVASLIASNLVDLKLFVPANPRYAGLTHALSLSTLGRAFVDGWKRGDASAAGLVAAPL